jgi:hypothetical protein
MPEFIEHPDDVEESQRPLTAFDLVFALIAVLASGFSGYTTYLGFSYDLPIFLSLVMAIIIGLGLLIINFRLKENRTHGEDIGRTLLAFLLFFIVSFISNTNAIYTYFIQNDIVGQTQTAAWDVFDSGTQDILAAIGRTSLPVEVARTKQALDIQRRNLRDQITDVSNPGMGPRAREHLEEIERLLGVQLTRLAPPGRGASMSLFRDYADRLDSLIEQAFATRFQTTVRQGQEIDTFTSKINKLRTFYGELVANKEFSSDTTDLMRNDLASLYVEAQRLVGYNEPRQEINTSTDDYGSFQYTWNNFYHLTNIPAIVLSIVISIMLDVLTPILSLLLYKRDELEG